MKHAGWKVEDREEAITRYCGLEEFDFETYPFIINMPTPYSVVGRTGAIVTAGAISKEEAKTIADLIVAAPKMYEACRFALTVLRRLSNTGHYPTFLLAENGGCGYHQITDALESADGQDYSRGLDDLATDGG